MDTSGRGVTRRCRTRSFPTELLLVGMLLLCGTVACFRVQAQGRSVISDNDWKARYKVLTGQTLKVRKVVDPIAGEIWIYILETVRKDVVRLLPSNQTIQVTGVIGRYLENKGRYEFRTDDGARINVIGDFPAKTGAGQRWVLLARVRELGDKQYELSERKKWRPAPVTTQKPPPVKTSISPTSIPEATPTWWQNPLILIGLLLIAGSLVTLLVMLLRNNGEERRRAEFERQQQALAAQNAQAEAARIAAQQAEFNRRTLEDTVVSSKATPSAPPSDGTLISIGSLKVLSGPHGGDTFPLILGENRVGRKMGDGNSVVLDRDREVSGQHGSLIVSHGGTAVFKDNSSNGSRVNNQTVLHSQVSVQSGAHIEVGGTILQLTLKGAVAAPSASSARGGDTVAVNAQSTPVAAPANGGSSTMFGFNATLEVVDGPDRGKPVFTLTKKKITMGRNGADFLLSDPSISAQHATLTVEGGRFLLADNGSTNGTKVNDEPVDSSGRELQSGDRIGLGRGQTVLVFKRYN